MLVAGVTGSFGVIDLMAVQAAIHGRHARYFGHRGHLRHRSMTRFTFYSRGQVSAMGPRNAWQNLIDAHPRDRFFRTGVRRQLLDPGLALPDPPLSLHATGPLLEL